MYSYLFPQKPCGLPFKEAIQRYPSLRKYATNNRIDLGDRQALLLYNRLVLQDFMSLDFMVPPGFLIPTICSRWAFIRWIIRDSPSKVLEIGTGSSAILALMFAKIGCFVEATEINDIAYQSAQNNINLNNLDSRIRLRKVHDTDHILRSLYTSLIKFDMIACNPPQYDKDYYFQHQSLEKGFSGQKSELIGGESGHEFIITLIEEVATFTNPPSLYFQLTVPNLQKIISSYLQNNNYSFIKESRTIGTRLRYYFRVSF
ncbi:MAG: RlmF-related methyltransferase [Promethearchaeota archaeon]